MFGVRVYFFLLKVFYLKQTRKEILGHIKVKKTLNEKKNK